MIFFNDRRNAGATTRKQIQLMAQSGALRYAGSANENSSKISSKDFKDMKKRKAR